MTTGERCPVCGSTGDVCENWCTAWLSIPYDELVAEHEPKPRPVLRLVKREEPESE